MAHPPKPADHQADLSLIDSDSQILPSNPAELAHDAPVVLSDLSADAAHEPSVIDPSASATAERADEPAPAYAPNPAPVTDSAPDPMSSSRSDFDAPSGSTSDSLPDSDSGGSPVFTTDSDGFASSDVPASSDALASSDVPASSDALASSDVPASSDALASSDVPASPDAPASSDAFASPDGSVVPLPIVNSAAAAAVEESSAVPEDPLDEEDAPLPANFTELGLSEGPLLRALEKLGWATPTRVQARTFGPISACRDVLVQSQTGTGKTGAFCVPWLASRFDARPATATGVQLLVLTPTRELAKQVCDQLVAIAHDGGLIPLPIYGGTAIVPQLDALKAGVHAVVGTPGRILDHIRRRTLKLDQVGMVVLDEADEMLSMGFLEDIHAILDACPRERQTCLFSATVPVDVERIARRYMRDPVAIRLSGDQVAAAQVHHTYYTVSGTLRSRDLLDIIALEEPATALVFCNTREETNLVANVLRREGYLAEALSSDLSQTAREKVLGQMRSGRLRFLVATDVASRGIDISHISHVINYTFPENAESYIHRTGRTGRAGRAGQAISLIAPQELGNFYYLKLQYASLTFESRDLPPAEELEARRVETKLDQVSSRFPDLVSPEWRLLARNLMSDPRGEHVIAFLLSEAMAKPVAMPSSLDARADESPAGREDEALHRGRFRRDGDERRRGRGHDQGRGRDAGRGRDLDPSREARSRDAEPGRRDSSRRGEARGSEMRGDSDRGEMRGDSDHGETRGSSDRGETRGSSDRGEMRGDSDRGESRGGESRHRDGDRSRRRGREGGRERSFQAPDLAADGAAEQRPDLDRGVDVDGGPDRDPARLSTLSADADTPREEAETDSSGLEQRRRRRRRRGGERDMERHAVPAVLEGELLGDDDEDGAAAPAPHVTPMVEDLPMASTAKADGDQAGDSETDPEDTLLASPDSADAIQGADAGASLDAGRRRRRRRRRRKRRDEGTGTEEETLGAAESDANDESDEDEAGDEDEAAEGEDESGEPDGGTEISTAGDASRRRRRRRGQRRRGPAGAHAEAPPQTVAVAPLVSQDQIVIDIDESELEIVRDEFGEIDELDDLTLKGRRRGVMDQLQEEVELEDLSDRDGTDATAHALSSEDSEGSADDDDDDALSADDDDDDDAKRKKRRRRRRKKKKAEAAPPPELTAPPHKDFWEVWAAKFTYREFEDDVFQGGVVQEEESEEAPPPAPAPVLPPRPASRSRPTAPPRAAAAATTTSAPDVALPTQTSREDHEDFVHCALNIGRVHGKKSAHIRELLASDFELTGKSIRDLTVGDDMTHFRIGASGFERLAAGMLGYVFDDVELVLTRLDTSRDDERAAVPTPPTHEGESAGV